VPAARSFVTDLRMVLRGRDFRRLFAVRLASQASDGAFQVGLASLVFFSPDRATTPQAVALFAVVTVLPYTLIGPFTGVLLDVWPRRQVLLVANAVRAVMVIGVAGLVAAGAVGPPLFGLALGCLSVNRFFLAGLGASLPRVVPRDELVMANAVSPTCGTVAALLGAGVGYLLHLPLGTGGAGDAAVLLLSAVGYAGSAALAGRMSRNLLGPDARAPLDRHSLIAAGRDVLRDLRDGAGHLRRRRPAAHALTIIGVHRIGYGVMTITLMLLCRNYFSDPGDTAAGLALLAQALTVSGVGVAGAAVLTPAAAARFGPTRWIACCVLAAGVMQLVLAVRLSVPLLLLGAFMLGLTAQGAKICVDALVQAGVDEGFRGRVFAFYDVVFNAAFVAAAGLSVLLLPSDGRAPVVFAAIAVLYLLAAGGYLTARRRDHSPVTDSATEPASVAP
jgi:MFS family permease